MPSATVNQGREKKLINGYPWVQKGEVKSTSGKPDDGGLVAVQAHDGRFLGIGMYNSFSRFPIRLLTTKEEAIDEAWFVNRFERARNLRKSFGFRTDSLRMVHAESDGIPGLIVDKYGDHLVVQVRSLGTEQLTHFWMPALKTVFEPESIYERSEMAGREEEKLPPRAGQMHGTTPEVVEITEEDLKFLAPVHNGLKTGYYLDQRATRSLLGAMVRPGDRVLDTFSYVGAFGAFAARAGASVTCVDILDLATSTAKENFELNGLKGDVVTANAFEFLEEAPEGSQYDWIILDPPAIAKTADRRQSLKGAIHKLVSLALPRLSTGGRLIVCSCAYQLKLPEMLDTVRMASFDLQSRLTLENVTYQDLDHPAPLHFPEGLYLKCAWLRKDEPI